ncbi:hypothetical protein BQ1740_1120 [Bacillus subtilis]|nr:hypothetical protein BQ1740_1120 [Bacillus subtilis]
MYQKPKKTHKKRQLVLHVFIHFSKEDFWLFSNTHRAKKEAGCPASFF